MKFDRTVFFNEIRDPLFQGALTQQNVDGMNVLLACWEYEATGTPMSDIRWLAYVLSTVFHETATRCWPVTEYGSPEYLQSKPYWPFVGRGYVQLTWEDNYRKMGAMLGLIDDRDLVDHPDVALDSLVGARILFRGMAEGSFTGRRLSQYFNDDTDDPVNARQIINGNDDDDLIAGYHHTFLEALKAASIDVVAA